MTKTRKKIIATAAAFVFSFALIFTYIFMEKKQAMAAKNAVDAVQVEFADSGLSQFIVNMEDMNGECFLYVEYGLVSKGFSAWVAPEFREDFAHAEGPMPIPESAVCPE